eukprot:gene18462-26032_t
MDAWLAYLTTGQSEYAAVVGVDSLWLVIINACCCAGVVFYRDEKDKSSKARLRPDSTMFINGAIFAKVEEKGRVEDIGIASAVNLIARLASCFLWTEMPYSESQLQKISFRLT